LYALDTVVRETPMCLATSAKVGACALRAAI
jgi:hypothetical protein